MVFDGDAEDFGEGFGVVPPGTGCFQPFGKYKSFLFDVANLLLHPALGFAETCLLLVEIALDELGDFVRLYI